MIDLTYLRTTTGNDTAVILELIGIFTAQLPELKKEVETAYKQKDWHNLKETAHKAKNSFMIIGAQEEANNLKQIEMMATQEDTHNLDLLVENFLESCKKVAEEIKQLKV
jgi:HPt (histidine-containing phosphotransfer) domain-containing protein